MTPAKVAFAVPFVFTPVPKPIVSVLLPSVTFALAWPASEAMDWLAPAGKPALPPMFNVEPPVPTRGPLLTATPIRTDVRPLSVGSALATLAFRMPFPPPALVLEINVGPRYVLAAFRFAVTPVTRRSSL